jgi:hypothetical protein
MGRFFCASVATGPAEGCLNFVLTISLRSTLDSPSYKVGASASDLRNCIDLLVIGLLASRIDWFYPQPTRNAVFR